MVSVSGCGWSEWRVESVSGESERGENVSGECERVE